MSGSKYTMGEVSSLDLPNTWQTLTADAVELTAELFRTLTSIEPSGNRFRVAVICASNARTVASMEATEMTVFMPVVPANRL